MININHVYEFCSRLKAHYNMGLTQQQMARGVKITGEYYSHAGQLLSLVLTVYKNKIETRIYDSAKRLIFNDSSDVNINQNVKVINFIQQSVSNY